MPASPEERDRDKLMRANAWRLLLIGGIGALIGFAVMALAPGRGAGVAIAALATVPTVAGLGLLISSWVAARAGKNKPFA
jgi:hypothetical protein